MSALGSAHTGQLIRGRLESQGSGKLLNASVYLRQFFYKCIHILYSIHWLS